MAEYKLTYFNTRGLAEPMRYMFALAGVPYEDIRLPKDEHWPRLLPEVKARFPWGVVPVLEFKGVTLSQSAAIARFLAKQFNLAGANDLESAQIDELVDSLKDWLADYRNGAYEQDEARKAEIMKTLTETTTPKYMGAFERRLIANGGKYFVGKSLSWADIMIAHMLKNLKIELGEYPTLKQHMDNFHELPQIKEWIQKRPETEI